MDDSVQLRLHVELYSGETAVIGPLSLGAEARVAEAGMSVFVGPASPHRITVTPPPGEAIAAIEYAVRAPMGNFEEVVGPDSGRWFMNLQHVTAFWKYGREARSRIDDIKVPLYLFTGRDRAVELAAGIVGPLAETDLRLLEPVSNRALNVHTGGVEVAIRRGTADYPLDPLNAAVDGSVTEHLYLLTRGQRQTGQSEAGQREAGQSWASVLRDFSGHTRRLHGRPDQATPGALEPFWCSWTDWSSDDLDEDLVLGNVRAGLDVGIRNFIIDDGWFGPGLDSPYGTPLNIGDWTPDRARFPDLPALVRDIGALGGRALIWCAPHAVGPAAECFDERRPLLIAPASGEPVRSETQFYSLCFMSPEAREVMAGICVRLAQAYGFHGAKYDLFNWVPDIRCRSPFHEHDVTSMITGLELLLAETDRRTREIAPDYIVELKQNYGTALLTPYGSCMRAGDAPFDPRSNFLRTLHVQAYTPFALNDYQTFAPGDTPEDIAVAVLTMLAVGIPAYGADLVRLPEPGRQVLRHHHALYAENVSGFRHHRTSDDNAHCVLRARAAERDLVFLLTPATACRIDRPSVVLNAGYATRLTVDAAAGPMRFRTFDPAGAPVGHGEHPGGPLTVAVPPGGSIVLTGRGGAGESE